EPSDLRAARPSHGAPGSPELRVTGGLDARPAARFARSPSRTLDSTSCSCARAPERPAANLGGVVLDEAFVAPGAGEVEVLAVVQLAYAADDGADGVRALQVGVEHRPLQGDVTGQPVHPRRVVVREPAGGIATSQVS